MAEMHFLPDLTRFLRDREEIYTVRRFRYQTHLCYVPNVGACERKMVRANVQSSEDLADHYLLSGFKSAEEWWKKIQAINKGKGKSLFMYHVRVTRPTWQDQARFNDRC